MCMGRVGSGGQKEPQVKTGDADSWKWYRIDLSDKDQGDMDSTL